jgi:transcriptional regulator with XRE-family HTH domain
MKIHPIKIFCLENNISQRKIANKLGITDIYLVRLLSLKATPSPKLAKKIHDLTNIPILDLLYPNENNDNQKTGTGA